MKLKGNTPDERLNHVEVLLKHMKNKLHKTVVGIIPPTLVSNFVQEPAEDGLVLTAALFGGKISKGLVVVREMPEGGVEYILKTTRPSGILSRSMKSKRKVEVINLDLELLIGDVIEFYVKGEAKNIWVSFLWEAEMIDKRVKQVMIAELEENAVKMEASEDEGV